MSGKFQCKISPCLFNLNTLNKKYDWIPGKDNIRPLDIIIEKKNEYNKNIINFYEDEKNFILAEVFHFESSFNKDGKVFVKESNIYKKHIFQPNIFPYNVKEDTQHYIMWYSYFDDTLKEEKINEDIYNQLKYVVKNDNFDFVWYENPKKTIKDIYHLQVFWINLN